MYKKIDRKIEKGIEIALQVCLRDLKYSSHMIFFNAYNLWQL